MLQQLTIANFILVERAEMQFSPGLCVLTGETGAGKSILLGALGLILGERASGQPLFDSQKPATLTAHFTLTPALQTLCEESGLAMEDDFLLIRRQLMPDGKSRAFINDQPVSVALLKQLGENLVEILGQQGQRALTDKALQRDMLDRFAGHEALVRKINAAYQQWDALVQSRQQKEAAIKQAAQQEDYLRHIHAELSKLNPQPGEEEELAVKRRQLMQAEKLGGLLNEVQQELAGANPVEEALARATRLLARSHDDEVENTTLTQLLESLDQAQQATAETLQSLDSLILDSGYDPKELDHIETRLFDLRGAARKHQRPVEELVTYAQEITETLAALDSDESALLLIRKEEAEKKAVFLELAQHLSSSREKAGEKLSQAVMAELKPLKMEATRFAVAQERLEETQWNASGIDQLTFTASTNPGAPFGPIARIASGGELSRFMLALKVVLAGNSAEKTLIFDEIDTGTSGAVADAIGERLSRLSQSTQVMCITHLPQVASKGSSHFKVAKQNEAGKTRTTVTALNATAREEELAAMLSGKEISSEARQMAQSMLRAC
jgi:DNA repair protein RecN (Recombination protein N)